VKINVTTHDTTKGHFVLATIGLSYSMSMNALVVISIYDHSSAQYNISNWKPQRRRYCIKIVNSPETAVFQFNNFSIRENLVDPMTIFAATLGNSVRCITVINEKQHATQSDKKHPTPTVAGHRGMCTLRSASVRRAAQTSIG
jgi:hypothetical protein